MSMRRSCRSTGARAPIQWSIINGERETGITTMYMAQGIDTGDMILKHAIPIAAEETAGTLHDKLMGAWRADAIETLERIEKRHCAARAAGR